MLDRICAEEMGTSHNSLLVQYQLEKASFKSDYFETTEASLAVGRAAELAGIKVELGGALGRRTRFQDKSISQLVLSVCSLAHYSVLIALVHSPLSLQKSISKVDAREPSPSDVEDLPTVCANSDDTVLDSIRLDDSSPATCPQYLSDDQLAVVLALVTTGSSRRSLDELDREEACVYVEEVC